MSIMDYRILTPDNIEELLDYNGVIWSDDSENINDLLKYWLEHHTHIYVNYAYQYQLLNPQDGESWESPQPADHTWHNQRLDDTVEDPGYFLDFDENSDEMQQLVYEVSGLSSSSFPIGTWFRIRTDDYETETGNPAEERTDDDDVTTIRNMTIASRYLSFCMYYAIMRLKKPGKQEARMDWIRTHSETFPDPWKNYSHSNFIPWLNRNKTFYPNIRIILYSTAGTVLHIRKAVNLERTIHLQYDAVSRMWRNVYNIRQFFKIREDKQMLCEKCKLWHGKIRCPWRDNTITTPDHGPRLYKFPAYKHQAVVYADSEAYLEPVTENKQLHHLYAVGYLCTKDGEERYYQHTKEPTEKFIDNIVRFYALEENTRSHESLEFDYSNQHTCQTCQQQYRHGVFGWSLSAQSYVKVCSLCWTRFHDHIVVYFHNNAKYDINVMLKQILSTIGIESLDREGIIAKGASQWESYKIRIPETEYSLLFRDSMKMITASIKQMGKVLGHTLKGDFPYKWFDMPERMNEDMPGPEHWNGGWEEARILWNQLGMTRMKDYLLYYLKQDVTILAKSMDNFRHTGLNKFKDDPAFFHGAPSYFFHFAKNMSRDFEHQFSFTDVGLQQYYWDNIRGGICQASWGAWQQEKDGGSAVMVDVSGMYASVMRDCKLPIGKTIREIITPDPIRWVMENVRTATMGENWSFHAEIVWRYPTSLHERDFMLPLIEKRTANGLINSFEKFKPQLHNAERILQILMAGIEIENVTRIFEFEQEHIFTEHVSHCLDMRQEARRNKDPTLDQLAKLGNNAVYGKTMENVAKYLDIVISLDLPDRPYWNQMTLKEGEDETEYYVYTKSKSTESTKTPHMGFAILEHSKVILYGMIHEVLGTYDDVLLAYTDTDSALLFSMTRTNLWDQLLTDFPDTFYNTPEKQLGKWESEGSKLGEITGFVCLSGKQYCIRGTKEIKRTHKGVSPAKFNPSFEDYLRVAMDEEEVTADITLFERRHLEVHTHETQKLGLSYRNNKRLTLEAGGCSVPFGYRGKLPPL